jgi:hypothetical protein
MMEKERFCMFKGLTGKKVLFLIIGIAVYMATVFVCEFLGYVSPALWVFATAVAVIADVVRTALGAGTGKRFASAIRFSP